MPITSSRTHFGLGGQTQSRRRSNCVAETAWPRRNLIYNRIRHVTVSTVESVLPWIFARAGGTFQFVKDFIWRFRWECASILKTPPGSIRPRIGFSFPGNVMTADTTYEIRITAELWETHFFDQVALKRSGSSN